MLEKAACFTGHRLLPYGQERQMTISVREQVLRAYKEGFTVFYSGGALGFDTLAARAVLELSQTFSSLRLYLALPCENQGKGWTPRQRGELERLKATAHQVHILSPDYYPGCMHARNRFMVDHSQLLICYYESTKKGGTAYTVAYAAKNGLEIRNLSCPPYGYAR